MQQARFHAMGTDVHVIVVGGPPGLAERARERVEDLERRWSRFRADSEVSRLNARAGAAVPVSDETVDLVACAIEGWRLTGAAFDATVLGAMLRAGYTRSFDGLPYDTTAGVSDLVTACTDIEIDGNRVRLPSGTGFDPGGIGKGLAADIVTTEVIDDGADGVCINIGGDLCVAGQSPEGDGWTVAIEHPWSPCPIADIGVANGAVATSTTLRRRWTVDGDERHHVIDPRTGEPADTDVNFATVVAGAAWLAEVLAKAVLVRGSAHPFDVVDGAGAHALAVCDTGAVMTSDRFGEFLGFGWVPERLLVDRAPASTIRKAYR